MAPLFDRNRFAILIELGTTAASKRKGFLRGFKIVGGDGQLPKVIHALRPSGSFPGGLDGRQQQGDKNADNCDHDQKLDQRKTV
jgi:hypothetical protein